MSQKITILPTNVPHDNHYDWRRMRLGWSDQGPAGWHDLLMIQDRFSEDGTAGWFVYHVSCGLYWVGCDTIHCGASISRRIETDTIMHDSSHQLIASVSFKENGTVEVILGSKYSTETWRLEGATTDWASYIASIGDQIHQEPPFMVRWLNWFKLEGVAHIRYCIWSWCFNKNLFGMQTRAMRKIEERSTEACYGT